ncbi:hypothetical protein BJV82DRAFT_666981 [Fennellomyces sp. T-0311]|nr:hypothetical protein BJV82DRAFT_666981 [Fennellomyces sp. T-0311]
MSTENMEEIDKLRNNIEFASIAQFFHTFQSAFHPWPVAYNPASFLAHHAHNAGRSNKRSDDDYVFATEDLEGMLLNPQEQYRLVELLIRMLRLLTRNRFINNDTWQMYFAKEIDKRGNVDPNPLRPENEEQPEDVQAHGSEAEEDRQSAKPSPAPARVLIDFFTLPLTTRVHLLYTLCEWQLDDPERFREHLDNEEDAVHWRVEPIGYDVKGSSFWLFDDNRLYKETPEPKLKKPQAKKSTRKVRSRSNGTRRSTRRSVQANGEVEDEDEDPENWVPWKLVCLNQHDWEEFPKKFESSKHPIEQRFYSMLVNDVLPQVLPVIQEHEDAIKKKEALAHRKRSSRLMFRELEALEKDQQSVLGETRRSSRREEMKRKREEDEKNSAAKAREERLRDRERRQHQREHAQEENERRKALAASKIEAKQEKPASTGKKRGRKPKNKNKDEDVWSFDCVCGVSGQNIDDGSPMIACERCGTWQHIRCLQNAGQIAQDKKTLNKSVFFCKSCQEKESQDVDVDGFDDNEAPQNWGLKRTKVEHIRSPPSVTSQPPAGHSNGNIIPIQAPPRPVLQTWPQRPPSAPANVERFSSPVFPILKPMLPANFANGNGHHTVLPPLLPQVAHPMPGAPPHNIRTAPSASYAKLPNLQQQPHYQQHHQPFPQQQQLPPQQPPPPQHHHQPSSNGYSSSHHAGNQSF